MADKRTALFPVHQKLGAKLISFGGWTMPVEYSGIAKEHTAVRTAAGLFDISHMGEFEVTGPQALDLVQYVTCNDAARLADGQAQYSVLPTPDGTAVDDLLVYRYSGERFMLVVNAANIEKDFQSILSHNHFDAKLSNLSDETGLLALQGPQSGKILQSLTPIPLDSLRRNQFAFGPVLGVDATISRTGYTGEDGFELYFPAIHSEKLWTGIVAAGGPLGLLPAGLGARNTLRLEATLLLYGNDLDETTPLLEAGLAWVVKLSKGEFVGRQALLKQVNDGVRRKLVGFEMFGRDIARDHYPVRIVGKELSHVTSGSPSITLKKNIGLTYMPLEYCEIGTRLEVLVRGRACDAQVVPTPFYKREYA
jgi:aminomethyltransferase